MIHTPQKNTHKTSLELTTRPTTPEEISYYSFLKKHYEERVEALPDKRFIKTWLKGIESVLKTGMITTFEKD